jgi:hypothetical protein
MKEGKSPTRQGAADIIREKSKAGQLVSAEEIFPALNLEEGAKPEASEESVSPETQLNNLMAENKDLKAIRAAEGTSFYYSSVFMSDTYATLLLHKEEGPKALIADTVREDSDRYPRPTLRDVFKETPFDLSEEELLSCLQEMSHREEYQDISQVATSAGHVFLYSSRYLDRDYALMLAEWMDVGQFENP